MRPSPWVRELALDIEVAIREFLERHPRTSASEIRHAMRIAARKTRVSALGRGAATLFRGEGRRGPRDETQ
jgi:hypothetical protein